MSCFDYNCYLHSKPKSHSGRLHYFRKVAGIPPRRFESAFRLQIFIEGNLMTVKKKVAPVKKPVQRVNPQVPPAQVADPGSEGCLLPVATENEYPHGLGENPTYKSVPPSEEHEEAEENEEEEKEIFVGENTDFVPASEMTIVAENENETTVTFKEITVVPTHGINDTPWPRPDSNFNIYHMS